MREGTIYPILARFQEDGLVRSEVRASENGPPRKYFQITPHGIAIVEEMNEHWRRMESAMQQAIDFSEKVDER